MIAKITLAITSGTTRSDRRQGKAPVGRPSHIKMAAGTSSATSRQNASVGVWSARLPKHPHEAMPGSSPRR